MVPFLDTTYQQRAHALQLAPGSREHQALVLLDKTNTMKKLGAAACGTWALATLSVYLSGTNMKIVGVMAGLTLLGTFWVKKFHDLAKKIEPIAEDILASLRHRDADNAAGRLRHMQDMVDRSRALPQIKESYKSLFAKLFAGRLLTASVRESDEQKQLYLVTLYDTATFNLAGKGSVLHIPQLCAFMLDRQGTLSFLPDFPKPTVECTDFFFIKTRLSVSAISKSPQGYTIEGLASSNLPLSTPQPIRLSWDQN